jgi:HEPN domain-containing protein
MNLKEQERINIAYRLSIDSMNDYDSSRLLIREKHVLNSIQLACTAVEKLLKSFLYFKNITKIHNEHDPSKILRDHKEIFEENFKLNMSFLKWLGKVYKSRYTSDYGNRKEIQFGEKYFLAELDTLFFQVFSFYKISSNKVNEVYFNDHRSKTRKYENYLMQRKIKEEFLIEPQCFFAFQLFGTEHLDIAIEVKTFNPVKPFIYKDSLMKNGEAILEVDFGLISLNSINK